MTILSRQPISIVGGGLSGLALGTLLSRHGINVELFESHAYPHHRVCGEFISGLQPELIRQLEIEDLLTDAHRHKQTSWHNAEGHSFYQLKLHRPAYGISRHTLDERLATRFREAGGNLIQHRWRDYERVEKVIYTTGRQHGLQKQKSKWLGLKLHVRGFHSESDLEMHLGHGGYVGASAVEKGMTNLCGLFPIAALQTEGKGIRFETALDAIGLHHLRKRLASCEIIESSRCGTMYFQPGYQTQTKNKCSLGDSMMQIPPFTGHGMTMALEAAWLSHRHILDYVTGVTDWIAMNQLIHKSIHQQHASRLQLACLLHPFMIQGRLPQYWKFFGAMLKHIPPRVAPALWGEAPRFRLP